MKCYERNGETPLVACLYVPPLDGQGINNRQEDRKKLPQSITVRGNIPHWATESRAGIEEWLNSVMHQDAISSSRNGKMIMECDRHLSL